jgi:Ca-activated chloride channel family protein
MKMKFLFLVIVVVSGTANSAYSQNYVDSLNAARRASNNGQYRKALKYYKSTERIKPKDLDLSQEMGQTAYKAGDYETAKRCFDNLSANSKSSKERSNHLTDSGISSLGSEDYKGAEETFKDALRENPNNEKARQLLMEAKRKRKQKECQNNSGGEENKQDGQQEETRARTAREITNKIQRIRENQSRAILKTENRGMVTFRTDKPNADWMS